MLAPKLKENFSLPNNNNDSPMTTLALYINNVLRRLLEGSKEEALKNELGEYEDESVQKTLDNAYVPKPILEARQLQDAIIAERFKGKKLSIADIGCGDGYHGEIVYEIEYKGLRGQPFNWLFVDFSTLTEIANEEGFKTELLAEGDLFSYLARLH